VRNRLAVSRIAISLLSTAGQYPNCSTHVGMRYPLFLKWTRLRSLRQSALEANKIHMRMEKDCTVGVLCLSWREQLTPMYTQSSTTKPRRCHHIVHCEQLSTYDVRIYSMLLRLSESISGQLVTKAGTESLSILLTSLIVQRSMYSIGKPDRVIVISKNKRTCSNLQIHQKPQNGDQLRSRTYNGLWTKVDTFASRNFDHGCLYVPWTGQSF
jgi:hypothetical protein